MGRSRERLFRKYRTGPLIEGRFAYAVKSNPISAGHTKTGTYVDENRKLDAILCVKGLGKFAEANASAPTAQLQIIRVALAVIAYRMWDFRAMGVARSFLRSGPLKRDAYARLPGGVEKGNVARGN